MIDLFTVPVWQMTFGERTALEGTLSQLRPSLSIEIGTAEGGSLQRIAAHSREVHSFDLVEPERRIRELANVTLHTGDSHVLLARFLGELEDTQRGVDFALVDGDHTAEGVRMDIETLLLSAAVRRCVILVHDTANDIVREGLEGVSYPTYAKVTYRDLDFLAGHLSSSGPFQHQLWGGLGLIVCDDRASSGDGGADVSGDFYSSFELFAAVRDGLVVVGGDASPREAMAGAASRIRALSEELTRTQSTMASIMGSASWRRTAPLRKLKAVIQSRQR